jgi:hypothetical protein
MHAHTLARTHTHTHAHTITHAQTLAPTHTRAHTHILARESLSYLCIVLCVCLATRTLLCLLCDSGGGRRKSERACVRARCKGSARRESDQLLPHER